MAWPKGKSRPPYNGAGRPQGAVDEHTREIRAFARSVLEQPKVRARYLRQAIAGDLSPTIEQLLFYYAYGKPKEQVEHSSDSEHPLMIILDRGRDYGYSDSP